MAKECSSRAVTRLALSHSRLLDAIDTIADALDAADSEVSERASAEEIYFGIAKAAGMSYTTRPSIIAAALRKIGEVLRASEALKLLAAAEARITELKDALDIIADALDAADPSPDLRYTHDLIYDGIAKAAERSNTTRPAIIAQALRKIGEVDDG